ncbi:MAG: preprotein translocase subunit YajC [Clostridiales Family XIII bacterium]|jgi:preprotein translocase YajC subunit|nr:preprotein translocase subunit YajC [Clostridiales Family XIII bacterium]
MDLLTIAPIILVIAAMYFIMIRPQRKKERQINDMRNKLKVGDKITTIGGIKGTIVKAKDEVLTLQVGADRVKIDIMRWAISRVDEEKAPSVGSSSKKNAVAEDDSAEKEDKPAEKPARKPRKLTAKKTDEADSENAEDSNSKKTAASGSKKAAASGSKKAAASDSKKDDEDGDWSF